MSFITRCLRALKDKKLKTWNLTLIILVLELVKMIILIAILNSEVFLKTFPLEDEIIQSNPEKGICL